MKLLCGIRRYGSIYKSLPCILFRACASIQAALIILLRHFTYQAYTVYKRYSVRSRARNPNRYLRVLCLKSENALEVLRSSSICLTQWLHRFEGAWYASIVVAGQIGHALQRSGAGSVRSARPLTTSTRYGSLRYLIYFAVRLTRYSIEWRNYGPSYSIRVPYQDSLCSINPTTN